jgi:hypothetical protein
VPKSKNHLVQITHIFRDILLITVADESFTPQWFFEFGTTNGNENIGFYFKLFI